MKFCFEILDEDFEYLECGEDFKQLVISAASDELVQRILEEICFDSKSIANQIIKDNKKKIVDCIIEKVEEKVSESISRKKEILEITPKVSELAKINKENEEYFIGLIDKAIAKRFK